MASSASTLVVGTTKGIFTLNGQGAGQWALSEPPFPGEACYAVGHDTRAGRDRVWAAGGTTWYGIELRYSDDRGKTWAKPEVPLIKFDESTGLKLKQIWQITCAGETDDTMYVGVEPANLFVSRDAGKSFSLVKGLFDHPHREKWQPGFGGLCLHTVLVNPKDPRKLLVAISAGGVYRSDDAGATWMVSNNGIRAEFMPDKFPEFGQCVHKVVRDSANPSRLYIQNHWGLYRSDDDGAAWVDVASGMPFEFGFAMVAHPRRGGTAYVLPMESEMKRWAPEGKLTVWRTSDAGGSWQPLTQGLPQAQAFETVLRDGMSISANGGSTASIFFGTRSGKVYGSFDDGERWAMLRDSLPPVLCVRAVS